MSVTKTYEQILEEKGHLVFTNVGTSMMPLLRERRDLMIIDRRPYNADGTLARLNKYDAVLFTRGDRYVLHRIVAVHDGPVRTYDMLGDNQWAVERGVTDSQIIGVLVGVVRDGVEYDFTGRQSRLYRFIFCDMLPVRRAVLMGRDLMRRMRRGLQDRSRGFSDK